MPTMSLSPASNPSQIPVFRLYAGLKNNLSAHVHSKGYGEAQFLDNSTTWNSKAVSFVSLSVTKNLASQAHRKKFQLQLYTAG